MDRPKRQYLYIRNMVSPGDIQIVTEEAINVGLPLKSVTPGSVILSKKAEKEQLRQFSDFIGQKGFCVLSNKRERIIEAVKTEVVNWVQSGNRVPGNQNFSNYLSRELGKEYSYLSSIFSSAEKTTIEKFMMIQKAEKTKELLIESQLSLREIASQLGYGSTQLLSSQFKKFTGMSPSEYKKAAMDKSSTTTELDEQQAARKEKIADRSLRI